MHYKAYLLLLLSLIIWVAGQGGSAEDMAEEAAALQAQMDEILTERARLTRARTVLERQSPPGGSAQEFKPLEIPLAPHLQEHTWELCGSYDTPLDREEFFRLVLAVMWTESGQDPEVGDNRNPGGSVDRGIMQINSLVWPELEEKGLDVDDPRDNIQAGVEILAAYLTLYEDVEYALTAYNCGPAGAAELEGKSGFASKVLAEADKAA